MPGRVYASDLVDGAQVTTLEGTAVTIDLTGEARVNGARIIATDSVNVLAADVPARNGVIHVIDAVLLPPSN